MRKEERFERLNAILRSIRNINKLISKEKHLDKLIQKSCENFIEIRGYECAWIVLFDHEGNILNSAEAGVGKDLNLILEKLKDGPESDLLKNRIESSEVYIVDSDEILCGTKNGVSSCKYSGKFMVTRLQHEGTLFGIIGISTPVEITSDKEEITLFKEVAEDISFALHSIEDEKAKKEFEKALKYKARFENIVLDISTRFINLTSDKIQEGIEKALGEIGTFAKVDRSYLFQFSEDRKKIENKYVWYARGTKAKVMIPLQNVLEGLHWAIERIEEFEEIYVPNLDELPTEAKNFKQLLLSTGVKSILIVPLLSCGTVIGCIGFDSVTEKINWSDEIVYILKITGQIFANALERKIADEKLNESFLRMEKALEGTVQALSSIIEKKDPYTAGHQSRVAKLSVAIGEELSLSEERLENLRFASLLHDIGKIHIPAEILNKPYSLNKIEMGLVRTHPRIGYEILKSIDFPGPVPEIVLQHHERIDGSGYPDALSGDEILIEAQILGVSDLIESMSSRRPYRSAQGIDLALNEIESYRGVLYGSSVVDACIRIFEEERFSF